MAKIVSVAQQNAKIFIGLPWYKSVCPQTAFSVMALVKGRQLQICLCYDDAFVIHTRDAIATKFVESDAEWLLTIDDDMVVPMGHAGWFLDHTGLRIPEKFAGLNTLDRLLSHGKTLVGATYFGRNRQGPPVFGEGFRDKKVAALVREGPKDQLLATNWVGTGCLLVHRSVFEDIERHFPYLARINNGGRGKWFSPSEHKLMQRVNEAREMLALGAMTGEKALNALQMLESAIMETRSSSGLGAGEDVTLCKRAAEAGHQPYVDLGLWAGHIGSAVYSSHNTTGP